MQTANSKLSLLLAIGVLNLACEGGSASQVTKPRPELYVPANAQTVKVNGAGSSVSFILPERYPADEFVVELESNYHPPDWTRIDELTLLPGRKTSDYPAGWSVYFEGPNRVETRTTNWKKQDGTTVTYMIRYRWPQLRQGDPDAVAEVEGLFSQDRK